MRAYLKSDTGSTDNLEESGEYQRESIYSVLDKLESGIAD